MYSSHPPTNYHIFKFQQLHINVQQSKKVEITLHGIKAHEQLNISQADSVSKQVKQKNLI
jgi:hypothetical protein